MLKQALIPKGKPGAPSLLVCKRGAEVVQTTGTEGSGKQMCQGASSMPLALTQKGPAWGETSTLATGVSATGRCV